MTLVKPNQKITVSETLDELEAKVAAAEAKLQAKLAGAFGARQFAFA